MEVDGAHGVLLGAIVGDVLGRPWEGSAPDDLRGPQAGSNVGEPRYTDDTAMLLALATSLAERGELDLEDVETRFISSWEADPDRGYGPGTLSVFSLLAQASRSASDLATSRDRPTNGAAMRVAPLALLYSDDLDTLASAARASALPTHVNDEAEDGAVVEALAVAAALDDRSALREPMRFVHTDAFREALARAAQIPDNGMTYPSHLAATLGNSSLARESVPLAIVAASVSKSFDEAIWLAIAAGGDTDTTAAMAGAVAGARFGASGIPEGWLRLAATALGNIDDVTALVDRLTAHRAS